MLENKELLIEELTKDDIQEIKDLINKQLTKLFYKLYVKKQMWQ